MSEVIARIKVKTSEVIDRTKAKKSPTAAINGRREMLDLRNVRAAMRDKRQPAKTADRTALPMLVKERRTSPIAQEGGTSPVQAFVLVKEGRTLLTAALIAVWAAYGHRPALFGSGAADLAVAVLAVEVVVLVVEVVASVAVVAGGGRRSDIRLKHDIVLVGHLNNGLGLYRFSYNGSDKAYVGVIAQEVQQVTPAAVTRGTDGYLRVNYDKLGLKFQSYDQWIQRAQKADLGPLRR
jgi:hypothetical protein